MAAALSGDEIDRELIKFRLLSAAWAEIINQFRKLFENDLTVGNCKKNMDEDRIAKDFMLWY